MPSPFPCSPVIREWLWKKNQREKKQQKNPVPLLWIHERLSINFKFDTQYLSVNLSDTYLQKQEHTYLQNQF